MIYLTADEHYGHANVIKFCTRPFNSVKEMNDALIARHNERVAAGDMVYHLGDFCWLGDGNQALHIIRQLNGYHYFITGSHDKWIKRVPAAGPNYQMLGPVWSGDLCNRRVFLSHYPHISWPSSYHGSLHFHGHTHGNLPNGMNRMDVGVDVCSYRPISVGNAVSTLLFDNLLSNGIGV